MRNKVEKNQNIASEVFDMIAGIIFDGFTGASYGTKFAARLGTIGYKGPVIAYEFSATQLEIIVDKASSVANQTSNNKRSGLIDKISSFQTNGVCKKRIDLGVDRGYSSAHNLIETKFQLIVENDAQIDNKRPIFENRKCISSYNFTSRAYGVV